ncbi:MAG: hypothetical protein QNJ73_02150 [Gammaproteobacteria bacterium]|nr:hypothetical protein [Gammaproteobacteria bacterium]
MPARRLSAADMQDRRSDYDVTNRVHVSSVDAVRAEVQQLFQDAYPAAAFDAIWLAFHDFDRLFEGQIPGYVGCDTVYHDKQHSLDMTLAMARLLAGYEHSCDPADRLGDERAVLGLIAALYHDSGYIRRQGETHRRNGAEVTNWHVSRSAEFLTSYLPSIGLKELVPLATQVVHFTGYEINLDDIELDNPLDTMVGHLLGTADLIAQMADRCYLEKCRDRLYAEFVIGGIAFGTQSLSDDETRYSSGVDLLRQTPIFWHTAAQERLERKFNRAYRFIEPIYDGANPYMDFIRANLDYLNHLIESDDWRALRRHPDCFTAQPGTLGEVTSLVSRRVAEHIAPAQ